MDIVPILPSSLKLIAAGGAGFDWVDAEALGRKGMITVLVSL